MEPTRKPQAARVLWLQCSRCLDSFHEEAPMPGAANGRSRPKVLVYRGYRGTFHAESLQDLGVKSAWDDGVRTLFHRDCGGALRMLRDITVTAPSRGWKATHQVYPQIFLAG
jgi:hypothetical protein